MTARAAALILLAVGCRASPREADLFARKEARFPSEPLEAVLLYIPNRLVDLVDVIHAGVGIGIGPQIELHPTRYARLGVGATATVGIAWLGRFTPPFEADVYARAAAGQAEALASSGGDRWRIPQWDVGLRADFLYVGIAPDEIVDFFVGLTTFDLKLDDWGSRE